MKIQLFSILAFLVIANAAAQKPNPNTENVIVVFKTHPVSLRGEVAGKPF
jgi:hypothetical protein